LRHSIQISSCFYIVAGSDVEGSDVGAGVKPVAQVPEPVETPAPVTSSEPASAGSDKEVETGKCYLKIPRGPVSLRK
jgi:hypothetical protein